MLNLNKIIYSACVIVIAVACTKKTKVQFGVKEQYISDEKTNKIKQKSEAEYVSILYTNLYQKPISPNQLYKTQSVLVSVGDRNVANEMLLSNYFNTGAVQIPANTSMRNNLDSFIIESYKKFYLRYPSEAEKLFFKNYIGSNTNVTVEMVYTAMAASNEYNYY